MNDAPVRPRGRAASARRWGPLVAWVALMLVATSWPSPDLPNIRNGDKVVHAVMYGGLAFLAWRALVPTDPVSDARWNAMTRLVIVVLAASAFGWADEWHQQFIPGRSRDVADWQADTLGALLGATLGLAATVLLHREQPS